MNNTSANLNNSRWGNNSAMIPQAQGAAAPESHRAGRTASVASAAQSRGPAPVVADPQSMGHVAQGMEPGTQGVAAAHQPYGGVPGSSGVMSQGRPGGMWPQQAQPGAAGPDPYHQASRNGWTRQPQSQGNQLWGGRGPYAQQVRSAPGPQAAQGQRGWGSDAGRSRNAVPPQAMTAALAAAVAGAGGACAMSLPATQVHAFNAPVYAQGVNTMSGTVPPQAQMMAAAAFAGPGIPGNPYSIMSPVTGMSADCVPAMAAGAGHGAAGAVAAGMASGGQVALNAAAAVPVLGCAPCPDPGMILKAQPRMMSEAHSGMALSAAVAGPAAAVSAVADKAAAVISGVADNAAAASSAAIADDGNELADCVGGNACSSEQDGSDDLTVKGGRACLSGADGYADAYNGLSGACGQAAVSGAQAAPAAAAGMAGMARVLDCSAGVGVRRVSAAVFGCEELAGRELTVPEHKDTDLCMVPQAHDSYVFNDQALHSVLNFLEQPHGDSLYICGPSGSGKTSFVLETAARLKWPAESITLSQSSEVADLIGHPVIRHGQLQFEYGPLSRAMMKGEILLLNEIDLMSAGELAALNDVLEGRGLTVLANNGEVIMPHPGFRVIATGNSRGSGDSSGHYAGVRRQNSAFLDRWIFLELSWPDFEQSRSIISRAVPELNPDLHRYILTFVKEMRIASGNDRAGANSRLLSAMRARIAGMDSSCVGCIEEGLSSIKVRSIDEVINDPEGKNALEQELTAINNGLDLHDLDDIELSGNSRGLPLSVPLTTRTMLRICRAYVSDENCTMQDAVDRAFASRLEGREYAFVMRMSFEVFGYSSQFTRLPHRIDNVEEYISMRREKFSRGFIDKCLLQDFELREHFAAAAAVSAAEAAPADSTAALVSTAAAEPADSACALEAPGVTALATEATTVEPVSTAASGTGKCRLAEKVGDPGAGAAAGSHERAEAAEPAEADAAAESAEGCDGDAGDTQVLTAVRPPRRSSRRRSTAAANESLTADDQADGIGVECEGAVLEASASENAQAGRKGRSRTRKSEEGDLIPQSAAV